ncbi:hypothetical protein JXA80_09745 [bacterium]|nr:hypothetical protein [candidate division CSSED10-310 bacterium]
MTMSAYSIRHLRPVLLLFIGLQLLLFAPRLNSDGAYYYEYLRSWVIQQDLNFDDEREFYTWEWVPVLRDFLPGDWEETGYPPNIFSLGPCIGWLPFYALVHMLMLALGAIGVPVSQTGYGVLYRMLPMTVSMISGLITLILCDRLGKEAGFLETDRSRALVLILGASHFPAFLFITPAFAHAFSVMWTTWFMLMWYLSGTAAARSWRPVHYILYGMIGGMAVLMRWQNLFVMILPCVDALRQIGQWKNRLETRDKLLCWLGFASGLLVTIFPQLLVTHTLYGRWLTDPQGHGGMHWFQVNLSIILFDRIKGLFTVNPILLPAIIALPILWYRNRRLTIGLLTLTVTQTYINAVRRDWAGVGFGMRRFLNLMPAFALGMMVIAAVFSRPGLRRYRIPAGLVGAGLIIWNVLLMAQYYLSTLGAPWVNMSFGEMVQRQWTQSPTCLLELMGGALLGRGLIRDPFCLLLLAFSLVVTGCVIRWLPRISETIRSVFRKTPGRLLFFGAWSVFTVTSWLTAVIVQADSYQVIDLAPGTSYGQLRDMTLNGQTGYQGIAGGIRIGPGKQWIHLEAHKAYHRDRFLNPGMLSIRPVPPIHPDEHLTWFFPERVRADRLEMITHMERVTGLSAGEHLAEIAVETEIGTHLQFPVVFGRHAGSDKEQNYKDGVWIERDWPALHPIEEDTGDMRAIYSFDPPVAIRSVTIRIRDLPVVWTIRGIAFRRAVAPGKVEMQQ